MKDIPSEAQQLRELVQPLHDDSEEFPAVDGNAKRILASVEMLRTNLETD